MYLHRSNRAEVLVSRLADVAATPLGGPLDRECVVVQGKGMERWLTMKLAERHGVWANPDFPFARSIIGRAFAAVLPEHGRQGWDSTALTWATAKALLQMQTRSGFEVIRSYLEQDEDHRKLLQLSQRVASLLDGYAIYRPEMLLEWQEHGGSDWQAQLWQALTQKHRFAHIGALEATFMETLAKGGGPISGLPKRVSLFGISALPPLYLRVLAALATRIEVHLFLLSPSQQYWFDIRTKREVLREELQHPDELLEVGNELLASSGRLHRDFQYLLERDVDYVDLTEDYQEPRSDTVLGMLQSDILHLRDRTEGTEQLVVAPNDNSFTVHSCHGPTRELQVLHDQLTARLESDPTLHPRDIIVMTPDIERYAPFIDAVFSERRSVGTMPFHIADRAPRAAYPALDAFAQFLEIIPGRLSGPTLLDFLSTDAVRQRFAITADELPTIQTWITESNIRWGSDASHREAEGQPASDLNTWRFGLQRLLLGYASPEEGGSLFAGTLPFDDIEGGIADLLGRFAEFCESLFVLQEPFRKHHSLPVWQPILERALGSLILRSDDYASQHQQLRESFSALSEQADQYGFDEAISLAALIPMLEQVWVDTGTRSNFLSGGISFCQLMPMRSIPHRVVCVIGMNDGEFPRNGAELSFDHITSNPHLGDRHARDDDRYLFLEALLSARDALIITYTGQDNQSNSTLSASVLVEQLVSIAEQSTQGFRAVLQHPLQPFSPRYFDQHDPALFRFSEQDCHAARMLLVDAAPASEFLSGPLVKVAEPKELHEVSVRDFVDFFSQPSRYFLSKQVGLRLLRDQDELASREPLELTGLEQWHVGDRLLSAMLEHRDIKVAMTALRASGRLPIGTPGAHHLTTQIPLIESIVQLAQPFREQAVLPKLEVDFVLGQFRITGHLSDLWPSGRQEISYSTISSKRELRAWIGHVILCHTAPSAYPKRTIVIGRNGDCAAGVQLRSIEEPEPILRELLSLYEVGQATPLPLFPQASHFFAKHFLSAQKKNPHAGQEYSLEKAEEKYSGPAYSGPPPDNDDVHIHQVFGESNPIRDEYRPFGSSEPLPPGHRTFASVALGVYTPLFEHREQL